ncbi:MAG: hypothetical protein WD382_11470 [Halofilum sp. (in: g-proteobacteria)]
MTTDAKTAQPTISLAVFQRMLETITPERLRLIPVGSLPEEIPLEVVESARPELQPILEELALAVGSNQLSRWGGDREQYGDATASALEEADRKRSHEEAAHFQQAVRDLAAHWRERHNDFSARLERLSPQLDGLREEHGRLVHALQRIDDALEAKGPVNRLSGARTRLATEIEHYETALASYYGLNLNIARAEMRAKREEIEANAYEEKHIQERIDTLHERLEQTQSAWRRKLRPGVARRERERLQQRIQELTQQLKDGEVVIAERDMTRWLDAVVDASLYIHGSKAEQVLRDGRLQLFHLLNLFCAQQELAATQVAQNPFLQLDAEQAIEFLLVSERFIVQYFSRKRTDLTRWVGGEARRKLGELDTVQDHILGEYRRHRKYE